MAKACGCLCYRKPAFRRYPNLVKTKTRRSRSPHSLGPLPLVCRDSLEKEARTREQNNQAPPAILPLTTPLASFPPAGRS
jgi:hypothetical protein